MAYQTQQKFVAQLINERVRAYGVKLSKNDCIAIIDQTVKNSLLTTEAELIVRFENVMADMFGVAV